MTQKLEWRDAEKKILARVEGSHTEIIEQGHPEWDKLSQSDGIELFIPKVVEVDEKAIQQSLRLTAYALESDPLFFMAQRGEATMEEWKAKIEEIKARYPYPEIKV